MSCRPLLTVFPSILPFNPNPNPFPPPDTLPRATSPPLSKLGFPRTRTSERSVPLKVQASTPVWTPLLKLPTTSPPSLLSTLPMPCYGLSSWKVRACGEGWCGAGKNGRRGCWVFFLACHASLAPSWFSVFPFPYLLILSDTQFVVPSSYPLLRPSSPCSSSPFPFMFLLSLSLHVPPRPFPSCSSSPFLPLPPPNGELQLVFVWAW
jgi:hypothetical protein